jgi:hypothetical protein
MTNSYPLYPERDEYDDGYDSAEDFERAGCDTEDSLREEDFQDN